MIAARLERILKRILQRAVSFVLTDIFLIDCEGRREGEYIVFFRRRLQR